MIAAAGWGAGKNKKIFKVAGESPRGQRSIRAFDKSVVMDSKWRVS